MCLHKSAVVKVYMAVQLLTVELLCSPLESLDHNDASQTWWSPSMLDRLSCKFRQCQSLNAYREMHASFHAADHSHASVMLPYTRVVPAGGAQVAMPSCAPTTWCQVATQTMILLCWHWDPW